MPFFQKITQRLLLVLQFILVIIFILFEEVIWEGIAKPIYEKIQSFKLLQKFEKKLAYSNRYVILVVFLLLLFSVEIAGLLAGVFFVQGHILFGLVLYMVKIPIAAFVFWLFKVSKRKLLSFEWFKWSYQKVMAGLTWLKERETYQRTMARITKLKVTLKEKWKAIKAKYFSKESHFTEELKSFYNYIKNFKNRKASKKEDIKND